MAQFPVQISPVGQGLRNLLAIDFAEPLAKTMYGHARRAFAQAEPGCHGFQASAGSSWVRDREILSMFGSVIEIDAAATDSRSAKCANCKGQRTDAQPP